MSSANPNPYPVVYDAPSGALQYVFPTGQIVIPEASVNAITALTGDVVATGPGSVAATIQAGAVSTAKIATGAITATLIAAGAVKPAAISTTATDDFVFPRDITATRNMIVDGTSLTVGPANTGTVGLNIGSSLAATAFVAVKTADADQAYMQLFSNSNTGWIFVKQGNGLNARLDISDASNNIPVIRCYQGGGSSLTLLTTTQKNALTPIEGMMVYDTTLHAPCWYDGTTWQTTAHV